MLFYSLMLLPLVLGFFAVKTDFYPLKALVTLSCMGIIILFCRLTGFEDNSYRLILTAFLFSIGGDYFLSHKAGPRGERPLWFVYGIGLFFVAHLFYLVYISGAAVFSIVPLLLLLVPFLVYFFTRINLRLNEMSLKIAVFLYLIISCFSLTLAIGIQTDGWSKFFFISGIGLIVFSDTCIAETEFAGQNSWRKMILPTYYAAHIALTMGLLGPLS
jgi:hypothetical protein